MWPVIYSNAGGSEPVVSRRRKYAVQAARFMVQMVQTPLFSTETTEQATNESLSSSPSPSIDFDIGRN